MISNGRPRPVRDRGNLAHINMLDVHLPDDDLWVLLTSQPTPPQLEAGDKVSPQWVAWAKETIMDVSFVPARDERNDEGMDRDEALALYLCRLMRILDLTADGSQPICKSGVELENLLLGAAHIANLDIDLRRIDSGDRGTDDVLYHACHAGLIQAEKVEDRPARAKPGGGWTTVYSLTLFGRRKADGGGVPPPYRWSVQRDVDAALADTEAGSLAGPEPSPAESPPDARGAAPLASLDAPVGEVELRAPSDPGEERPASGPACGGGSPASDVHEAPARDCGDNEPAGGNPAAAAEAPRRAGQEDSPELDSLIGRMPEPDPADTRKVVWLGEHIYLGNPDNQVAKLFWLFAKRFGRRCTLEEILHEIDGFPTGEYAGSSVEQIVKAKQRVRSLVSLLRARLREKELDLHVVILSEDARFEPAYTMTFRPDLEK